MLVAIERDELGPVQADEEPVRADVALGPDPRAQGRERSERCALGPRVKPEDSIMMIAILIDSIKRDNLTTCAR